MVTFVAPTIKIGIILSLMVLICFGLINNRLRITAEMNSRIKTKPTAPKIGVVCLMKTNALLQTAESPNDRDPIKNGWFIFQKTDSVRDP